jgi:hypothetical protein
MYGTGNPYQQEQIKKPEPPKVDFAPRTIIRIEHPVSGKGPFTHDGGRLGFPSDAMNVMKEPQEFGVSALQHGAGWHYAFTDSMAMMRAVRSLVSLRQYGFHIQALESKEHIVLPDGQVAFIKDKSTVSVSLPIHEFPFEDYCGDVDE